MAPGLRSPMLGRRRGPPAAAPQIVAWRGPYLGVGKRSGASWQPYQSLTFVTPPFPGYVSGHASFSAAAAEVLPVLQPSPAPPTPALHYCLGPLTPPGAPP
jgi:membrane-associated phospholipid phosphatase